MGDWKRMKGPEESIHEVSPPETPSLDGWNGANDPDNPRNWSIAKKTLHTVPVALLCLSVTAGSSMISPGLFAIEAKFRISETVAILSLSLYVLGLALGPVIAAPISESFGRAVVYKITMPVYMLFIMGAGLSNSLSGLLVCRFLAAMSGAPCLAVGAGTVADLFEPHLLAIPGAFIVMAPFLGPCIGPVIGGFAAGFLDYRWTQWCTIFLAAIAYATVLPTQETHHKVILRRREKRLGLPPSEPRPPPREAIKLLLTITLFRPVCMLILEPIVLLYSLYNAFTFSILFAFFEAFPYVFIGVYGFNIWQYGLTFLAIGCGVLLGVAIAILIDLYVYQKNVRTISGAIIPQPPEQRLYAGMLGAFCLPIGLIWFALTAKPSVHWIVPVISGVPFAIGNVTVFISAALYMIDCYGPLSGASAMAANGILRYTMGAAFPLFTVQMYERMGIKWATLLLAFICIIMLPIPLVFFRYGPLLRKRSRYSVFCGTKVRSGSMATC